MTIFPEDMQTCTNGAQICFCSFVTAFTSKIEACGEKGEVFGWDGRQKLCFVDNFQWPKYSYFQRPADSKGKDKRVTTIYTHTRATHTHTHSMLCVKKTLVGDETDTRHRTKHTHDIVQCTINSTHVFGPVFCLERARVNSKYRATLIEVYTHTLKKQHTPSLYHLTIEVGTDRTCTQLDSKECLSPTKIAQGISCVVFRLLSR